MTDLYAASSGVMSFHFAPKKSSDEFYKKYGFSFTTMDVPYMFVPLGIASKKSNDICGMLGMITNNTDGAYQYFIVAGTQDSSKFDSVSVKLFNSIDLGFTDDYTVLLCLDDIQWDKNKDINFQIESFGRLKFGYYEMVKSASSADMFDPENIDITKINPYVITINRNVTNINYKAIKDFGVVGVIVEAGYLYDFRHHKLDRYVNPNLVSQIDEIRKNTLPFGFYAITRAKTVAESNSELDNLVTLLRIHSPILGVWIQIDFPESQIKSTNDSILDNYKKVLTSDRVGFQGSIGIYCSEKQLKRISWDKHCNDWYLWLERPVSDVNNIQKLLTPETFKVD